MNTNPPQSPATEPASGRGASIYGAALDPAREKRTALWLVGILALFAVVAVSWLGFRVVSAVSSLNASVTVMDSLNTQLASGDISDLADSSRQLSHEAGSAFAQTQDPIWGLGEELPLIGPNLVAIRHIAGLSDSVASKVVAPLTTSLTPQDSSEKTPVSAALASILALNEKLDPAAEEMQAALEASHMIPFSGAHESLIESGEQFKKTLSAITIKLEDAKGLLQSAPALLGADSPQTYLVVYQDLARPAVLGGSASLVTELTLDRGIATVGRQLPSSAFTPRTETPIVALSPTAVDLFGPEISHTFDASTNRPAWSTAGLITQAFWQADIGGPVEAVFSIDAIALSHFLNQTGPLVLSTGESIDAESIAAQLTDDVHSEEFLAESVKTVLEAAMGPKTEAAQFLSGTGLSVTEHRIMAWSMDSNRQEKFQSSPLSGVLPFDNMKTSTVGVFFRDTSEQPMGTYLNTTATLKADMCQADAPVFTATVKVRSSFTPEEAAADPSANAVAVTQVFVYGPPYSSQESVDLSKADDRAALDTTRNDMLRPVSRFTVELGPGESTELSVTYIGEPDAFGVPSLRLSPMINEPTTKVTNKSC